jgi:hypothetical protein
MDAPSTYLPMKPGTHSVAIAGEDVAGPRHACAFFEGPEEEYPLLTRFALHCVHCGERCFQFLDPLRKEDRTRQLLQAGMDESDIAGRTELVGWDESYLRGGRFVATEMLEVARGILERGAGAPRARVWANMEWAVQHGPVGEALVDYETRLNPLVERSDAIIVCAYQVGRHSPEIALGVLQAHPWVVVGGRFEVNPAYVPQ